jgi:hypothetical protein
MPSAPVAVAGDVRVPGFLTTKRTDRWWVAPAIQGLGFLVFAVYTTWAAFQNAHFIEGPYLSPFYAPLLWASPGDTAAFHHAWFGYLPHGFPYPSFLPYSPAVLILGGPLGFRLTCYYYRKFYYRAFFASPPSCAVGPITGASYLGERRGLFWLLNFHRFFFYIAVVFVVLLWWDAIQAFRFHDGFGIGVGTLVLLANVVLISAFTFGCNSFRHLVGGGSDCFSCEKAGAVKYKAWKGVSILNHRHMLWAWVSMGSVGFADLYIRLCSMGVIHDLRIL